MNFFRDGAHQIAVISFRESYQSVEGFLTWKRHQRNERQLVLLQIEALQGVLENLPIVSQGKKPWLKPDPPTLASLEL
jgi:hypothetical protein